MKLELKEITFLGELTGYVIIAQFATPILLYLLGSLAVALTMSARIE